MGKVRPIDAAKKNKRDEFYTQLVDIENEMKHYRTHFKNKTVYCNCDDPYESNFFKYFASNFNFLGLKRLITTSYRGSTIANVPLFGSDEDMVDVKETPVIIDIREVSDLDDNGAVDLADVEWLLRNDANVMRPLAGDGDFRSDESIELLEQADVIVTNPPFSLFKEYLAQLVKHNKQFLILGNKNAITYKGTSKLIMDGHLWLGCRQWSGGPWFVVPDGYEFDESKSWHKVDNGKHMIQVGAIWYTNLDHPKRHEPLPLFRQYSPDNYPHYDNYDAIEVSMTADIPEDWDGVMGVPISFLGKWCPEQFEIVGTTDRGGDGMLDHLVLPHSRRDAAVVSGKGKYKRIFIKRRPVN